MILIYNEFCFANTHTILHTDCCLSSYTLVKTHLLLYNNRSASLKLHFKQCTTLGLLETTMQLRQSLKMYVYFMYILCQLFLKLSTASATDERQIQ